MGNKWLYKSLERSGIGLFINPFTNLLQFIADIVNPKYTFERANGCMTNKSLPPFYHLLYLFQREFSDSVKF